MTPSPMDPAPGMQLSRLSDEQCQRLHEAGLVLLERTGVCLYEPEAVALVRAAGASISDGNRARIPPRLVEQALTTAPREVVLHDRAGRPAMRVGGRRTYCGPGSDCLNLIDHRTNERRRPVLQDVVEAITLCDALENMDFVMSVFMPSDVDPAMADRYQMEVMLSRTTKPIVFVTYDMAGCVDAIEMAEAVAGGADALRARPSVLGYINVTTGLRHNQEALQKLLFLAGKGLPALYVPSTSGGATGPITMAGSMAIDYAGMLAGLVISQLKRAGTPLIISAMGGQALDMLTLVDPYAQPEPSGALASLAHFHRLPMFSAGGCSDAKVVDQQAVLEAALTLMVSLLSGGHIIHDLGYLESGLTGSLAQLAMCDEIVAWVRQATRAVEITDETLALDVIEAAGPDGEFLTSDHTLRHVRDRWYPALIDRHNYDDWLARGGQSMAERAGTRVDEILASHAPPALPAATARALRAIVERAARHATA